MNVQRSALLPYNAAQMFAVIADVSAYPEFLNWCHDVELLEGTESELVAQMTISYGKLKFAFATRNQMQANESIEMRLEQGPFKHLSGRWLIQSLSEHACKVSLEMDFTFDNPITHGLFGKVFKSVVSAQVDAFQKRAQQIYGI